MNKPNEYNPKILLRYRRPLAHEQEATVITENGSYTRFIHSKTHLYTAVVGQAAYDYFKERHSKYQNNLAASIAIPASTTQSLIATGSLEPNQLEISLWPNNISDKDPSVNDELADSYDPPDNYDPQENNDPLISHSVAESGDTRMEREFFPFSAVFQPSSAAPLQPQDPLTSPPRGHDDLTVHYLDYDIAISTYRNNYTFLKEYSHKNRVLYAMKDVDCNNDGKAILVDRFWSSPV